MALPLNGHIPAGLARSRWAALSGFTLIELLVTIAILGIVLALGIPNLREFLVRSEVGSISNEFAADIARTRIEAISRNNCVTMCASTDTNLALASPPGLPSCAASGNNWQTGWIIFSNPTCALGATASATNTLVVVRQQGSTSFELERGTAAGNRFTFDSRGLTAGPGNNFTLRYVPEGINSPHYRTICVSSAGRVRTKKYLESCP